MIQTRTMLNAADNTGAKIVQCIQVLGGTKKRTASLGDTIVVVVKDAEPRKLVKKHQVLRAVIVRQAAPYKRKDGSYIRFDDNAVVLLEGDTGQPKGSRITGPIAREVKEKGFEKVAALAKEII